MSALRKMVVREDQVAGESIGRAPSSRKSLVAIATPHGRKASTVVAPAESKIKNVALFMVAPFIGLAYAMLFPFFAIGALAWMGTKALIEIAAVKVALRFAKKLAMFIAAPFVGLAFVAALPVAGIAALAWVGFRGRSPAVIAG